MIQMQLPDPDLDPQFYHRVPSRRLVAWLIDTVVVVGLSLAVTLVLGIITFGLGFMLMPAILIATNFLYRTLTIAQVSATWGMRAMGIELRAADGGRFTTGIAAVHTLIFMALMASMIGWIATVVSILVTRMNQGIPDLVLGSTAINRPLE